jgi:hypothetical protein
MSDFCGGHRLFGVAQDIRNVLTPSSPQHPQRRRRTTSRRLIATFLVLAATSPSIAQQTGKGTVTIDSVAVDGQAATPTINGHLGNFAQAWDGSAVTGYVIDKTTKVTLDDIAQVSVQDPPVNGQRTFTIRYRNVPNGTYVVFVKAPLSNQGPPLQTQDVVSATTEKAQQGSNAPRLPHTEASRCMRVE